MAEIFQNFEINRSPWWGRVWRIAAGSVGLHLILVATVLYVPAFREAFNIASVFSSAKYVDKDYDKTIIGERAVLINAKDVFEYPPGYFSNPAVDQAQLAPQIIATATPIPLPPPPPPVRQPKVKPTPAAVAAASPQPSPAASPQPSPAEDLTAAGLDENMTKEERDKKLDDIAAKNGVERPNEDAINKKPLKDWLAKAKEAKDKKEFDVTQPVEMTVEADLGPEGKLVNAQIVSLTGDQKLKPYVQDFFSALSDSRALTFLGADVKHIRLMVKLTDTNVTVEVTSEVESPDLASRKAKGYSLLLAGGRFVKKGQTEEIIYKNTKVSADGKQVVVNFTMPRKEATDILTKLSNS